MLQAMRSLELYVDKTIAQLTKVRTPHTTEQMNYENSPQQIQLCT